MPKAIASTGDQRCPEGCPNEVEYQKLEPGDFAHTDRDGPGDAQAEQEPDRQNQRNVMSLQQRIDACSTGLQRRKLMMQPRSESAAYVEVKLISEKAGNRTDHDHGR